jgi:precorrin-4 methylase
MCDNDRINHRKRITMNIFQREHATPLAIIVTLAAICAVQIMLLTSADTGTVDRVKSGETTLWCAMSDGFRAIDKDLVVGRDELGWRFTNGNASNCTIK